MYSYLYKITSKVTPLESDCGLLCHSICCRPDDKNSLGIYLFPGEEHMFTGREDWLLWEKHDRDEQLFPASWPETVYFVKCTKPCPRESRPLACRFFPLAPHLTRENELYLIYETMPLPYDCPLITNNISLRQDFINTVARCWEILLSDFRIRDLVEEDSREREAQNKHIQIIWPEPVTSRKAK